MQCSGVGAAEVYNWLQVLQRSFRANVSCREYVIN